MKRILEPFRGSVGEVLVVDDDVDTRQRLRLVKCQEARPCMILLDLTTGVMDGFAFFERPPSPGHLDVVAFPPRP